MTRTVESIGQGAYELGNVDGDDMVLAGGNSALRSVSKVGTMNVVVTNLFTKTVGSK